MERSIRQTRPQLVCILADNSGSMWGEKAQAATEGLQEMLFRCRNLGPPGADKSYFHIVLIRFSDSAEVDAVCNGKPVRHIDPERVVIKGDGGLTSIGAGLKLAYDVVKPFVDGILNHEERAAFPLPRVLVFSDGAENMGNPLPAAKKIKSLEVDGDHVIIAAAGVSVGRLSEMLLQQIASPGCYLPIDHADMLVEFLDTIGSTTGCSLQNTQQLMLELRNRPRLEGPK